MVITVLAGAGRPLGRLRQLQEQQSQAGSGESSENDVKHMKSIGVERWRRTSIVYDLRGQARKDCLLDPFGIFEASGQEGRARVRMRRRAKATERARRIAF